MRESELPRIHLTRNLMYLVALPPELPRSNSLKTICVLYIILFNMATIYTTYFQQNGRVHDGYRIDIIYKDVLTRYLCSFGSILLTLINMMISFNLILLQPKSHKILLRRFGELDRLLSYNFPKIDLRKRGIIRLIIVTSFIICAYGLDYYLRLSRQSISVYKYFFFDCILRYRLILFGHYMTNILREFNSAAKYMNKILKCDKRTSDEASTGNNLLVVIRNDVATLLKSHTALTDAILNFNKTFGWIFFFIIIDSLVVFLLSFQLCLKIPINELDLSKCLFLIWMATMMGYATVYFEHIFKDKIH